MRVENSGLGDDGEASGEAGDEIRDGRLQVIGRQPADYRDLPLTMLHCFSIVSLSGTGPREFLKA